MTMNIMDRPLRSETMNMNIRNMGRDMDTGLDTDMGTDMDTDTDMHRASGHWQWAMGMDIINICVM